MKFVHLNTHSHYSLLDGLSKTGQLIKKAKENGMDSLAITDHGNIYGAIEFYQKAKKEGIKPIIGCEMYVCDNMREKQSSGAERNYFHLILLAKNNEGYQNLIKLVTAANLEGFYYKPRVDKELIRKHSEGLIALSGCLGGELSRAIFTNQHDKAKKIVSEYSEIFGPGNYYIEIQQHLDTPDQNIVTPQLVKLAKELNLPLVATQDSHYLNKEVEKRRQYELEIIKNKNYAPYFLVVADLLRFAHQSRIYTTVRGSAAGSLVAYLSGITSVNPIEFQLPFERFLNPFRPSAPDFDMDFADNRRQEVIEYAKKKYGADKVAQIGTFGTMMARGAVRDVARALGKPYETGDRLAKLIPIGSQGFPMTIDHALGLEPQLKQLYVQDSEAREILDIAKKLEGTVRHVSVHAAGVVISPKPLVEYVPIQFDPKSETNIITQYDMYTVGEDGIGLTKLDFLGIRNLAILENAVHLVKQHRNIDIDIEKIPFDDKKTFEMLARGETEGLFQLNGSGMTKYL